MDNTGRHAYPPQTKIATGAPVSVVRLRDRGRRITKAELAEAQAEPMVGRLVVAHQGTNEFTTYRSSATLFKPASGDLGQVCNPLFDHVLEKMDSSGIILSGYEIDSCGGVTTQYVQVWWVRTLTVGQG